MIKVKQWIKAQEKNMIDLTKNQIVEPPIECWVRNGKGDLWESGMLRVIDHIMDYPFAILHGKDRVSYMYCSLTDPNKPKVKRWETVMDVPPQLWGKVLVKKKTQTVNFANIMEPSEVTFINGKLDHDMHYLPLGQPFTGEWLPFESEE